MKITPLPFELRLPRDDKSRSKGQHLTEITSKIALVTGVLDKRYRDKDINDPSGVYRVAAGLAWEDWIHPKHPDMLYHPGEVTLQDLAMTPDGVSFDDHGVHVIREMKFTWKSMRRDTDLSGEWLWMAQMMAYCNAFQTNKAILHVFWVNGDYRDSGPQYRLYQFEFTARELKDNWASIMNNR